MAQVQSADQKVVALDALQHLNDTDKKEVTATYLNNLSTPDQKEVVKKTRLPDPDATTINFIWRIVVSAFVITLIVAVAAIAYSGLTQTSTAQVLVTIFTTAVGFLGGLLTPSPAQQKQAP